MDPKERPQRPARRQRATEGSSNEEPLRLGSSSEDPQRPGSVQPSKRRGSFTIIPNKIWAGQNISTVAVVIDPDYCCAEIEAWLTKAGDVKRQVDLPLTPLSRLGVYSFAVPDDVLGKYHVRIRNSEKSLGIRSFTVSAVTAEFVYNVPSPLIMMSHALGVKSDDQLDKCLSQSFERCMPIDTEHLQRAFPIEKSAAKDQGATADCEVPTLLHFACKYNLTNLLSKLTSSPGAQAICFMKNNRGETPLDIAVSAGNVEAAEMVRQLQEQALGEEWEDENPCAVQDLPARPRARLAGSADLGATAEPHVDSPAFTQNIYEDMQWRGSAQSSVNDELYVYARSDSVAGRPSVAGYSENACCIPVVPPPVPRRRSESQAAAPLDAAWTSSAILSTAVAAVELDELSRRLQIAVKNGEMTQSEAVSAYENIRALKTKLNAERSQLERRRSSVDSATASGSFGSELLRFVTGFRPGIDAEAQSGPPVPPRSPTIERTLPMLPRLPTAEKARRPSAADSASKPTSAAVARAQYKQSKAAAGKAAWKNSSQ